MAYSDVPAGGQKEGKEREEGRKELEGAAWGGNEQEARKEGQGRGGLVQGQGNREGEGGRGGKGICVRQGVRGG